MMKYSFKWLLCFCLVLGGVTLTLAAETTLPPDAVVVTSFSGLKAALGSNNGISTVYLGADIEGELGGIVIDTSKRHVVVDGVNPTDPTQARPYTLTDYDSAAFTDIIRVTAVGPQTLTVKNLNIIGKNYYGPFGVIDAAALAGVTIIYQNVSYNGPQLGYHRTGTVRFIDCTATITGANGISPQQEFSEVKHVIFEGNSTITHTTAAYSVCWIPYGGSFTLTNDAHLTLTTTTTLGLFYANGAAYGVDVSLGARAVWDTKLATFFNATLNTVKLHEGSTFRLTTTQSTTLPVITLGGDVTIEREATFAVDGYGGTTMITQSGGKLAVGEDALLHLTTQTGYTRLLYMYGTTLTATNPRSVLLYNNKRILEALISPAKLTLNAQQLAVWTTAAPDSLDNTAPNRWIADDLLTVNGTLPVGASVNFNSLSGSDTAINNQRWHADNARIVAFGRHKLDVAEPLTGSTTITGVTEPHSHVRASITQNGDTIVPPDAVADADGVFTIPLETPLQAGAEITVRSRLYYLEAVATVQVSDRGVLRLVVPERLVFMDTPWHLGLLRAERLDPDWHLLITDTHPAGHTWRLFARLTQPLTPQDPDKPSLPDALLYVDEAATPLSDASLLIYEHVSTDSQPYKLTWPPDRGILLQAPHEKAFADTPYTAVIEWSLVDGP